MHGWGDQPMMGESDPQRALFYQLSLESFVPDEHPLRRIRPLIDDEAIRRVCKPLYSEIGRPSIPPEQLFLALIGGHLLGIPSERKLVMEVQCNMALRWFVGLNLDQDVWDASTFSQNPTTIRTAGFPGGFRAAMFRRRRRCGMLLPSEDLVDQRRREMARKRTDQVSAIVHKRRWSAAEARLVVRASQESGMPVSRFAQAHGLQRA